MLPESDDPDIDFSKVDWIRRGDYFSQSSVIAPWRSPLIEQLNKGEYDLVVLSFNGVMLAPYLRAPTVFYVTGGDMTMYPYSWKFFWDYDSIPKKLGSVARGWTQRRGLRAIDHILCAEFPLYMSSLRKFDVLEKLRGWIPLAMDTQRFLSDGGGPLPRELEGETYLFSPARIMINEKPRFRESGQWKRNDLFVRGFKHYLEKSGDEETKVAFVDKVGSRGTFDLVRFKEIIEALGITDRIIWLNEDSDVDFRRADLVPTYQNAKAVFSNFGCGGFASVGLEGLACGKPVFNTINEEVIEKTYPWHPFISADSPEGYGNAIGRLMNDEAYCEDIGKRGKQWLSEYHSHKAISERWVAFLESIAN